MLDLPRSWGTMLHTTRKFRRFWAALVVILFALGWHTPGVCESPIFSVILGDTAIGVRSPAGFIEPRIVNHKFGEFFKEVPTSNHRSLVVLVTHQDLRRMMAGKKPEFNRILRIDIHREGVVSTTSVPDFNLLKSSLHAMLAANNPAGEMIFDERHQSISRIKVTPNAVIATSLVLVRGKVIRVGVESTLEDGKNEDWVKSMTREFIGLIHDANRPFKLDLSDATSGHRSQFGSACQLHPSKHRKAMSWLIPRTPKNPHGSIHLRLR